MSYPPRGGRERSSTRSRRFTRLRTTADPTRLLTERANRLRGRPFGSAATCTSRCRARFPLRSVALISELRRSRSTAGGAKASRGDPSSTAISLLEGEPRATTLSAATNHVAPATRGHPRHEAVLSPTRDALRLPGPLRHPRAPPPAGRALTRRVTAVLPLAWCTARRPQWPRARLSEYRGGLPAAATNERPGWCVGDPLPRRASAQRRAGAGATPW